MSDTQHTPGPWSYSEGTRTIRGPQNHWLASMDSWDGAIDHAANARLIAAAPELLVALEMAYSVMMDGIVDVDPYKEEARQAARAAIAKATGVQS